MRKALVALFAILLLAGTAVGGVWYWADQQARQAIARLEGQLRRSGTVTASHGSLAVNPLRREVRLGEVKIERSTPVPTSLAIRQATMAGIPVTGAAAADRILVEGIAGRQGDGSLEAERIEVEEFAMARSAASPMAALESLSAQSVTVPELKVERMLGTTRASYVFRDVRAGSIAGGTIASLSTSGGTVTMQAAGNEPPFRASFGQSSATGLDLGALQRLQAGGTDASYRAIYDTAVVETVKIAVGNGLEVAVGVGRSQALALRSAKRPLAEETAALRARAERLDPAAPAEALRLLADALRLVLDHARLASLELREARLKTKDGAMDVRLGRLAFANLADDRAGAIEIEDIDAKTPDGALSARHAALQGLALAKAGSTAVQPIIEGVRLEGATGTFAGMQGSVGAFDVAARDLVGAAPTSTTATLRDGVVSASPEAQNQVAQTIRGFGYDRIALDADIETGWNPQSLELAIRKANLSGQDIGRASLIGSLGQVGPEAFSLDGEKALSALGKATLKELTLRIENGGLFGRAVGLRTALQTVVLPLLLRDRKLGGDTQQAFSLFLQDPRVIEVRVRPAAPAPLAGLMAGIRAYPADAMKALNLQVTANP